MDNVFCCALLAELMYSLLEIPEQSIPGVLGD